MGERYHPALALAVLICTPAHAGLGLVSLT
jgi:hypothetical protein